jgi:Cysteine rich repeat
VHQIAMDLTALRQTVDQLAASQDQIGRNIDRLQAVDQEILVKIPESPPPPPIAAPAVAGRPAPGGAPPSENTQNAAPTSASLSVGHAVTNGALRASCGPDVQRLCGGISRENGDVIKCLSSHRTELSPTCDAYFNKMPVQRAAQKGAPKATSPNR